MQAFYGNKISEEQLRSLLASNYQSNNPDKAAEWNHAMADIFMNGKAANTHIFFPETGGAYQEFQRDPEGAKVFLKVAGELTSTRCSTVQAEPIINALTPEEKVAFMRIMPLISQERLSPEENQKTIENIKTQPAPYVGLYGDGHRAQLTAGLKATSIGIIASEKDSYQGSISTIPEYIYYADTDRLLHIPEGSPQRAEFMAKQVMKKGTLGDQTISLGKPLTLEEMEACIDALPADVRNKSSLPYFPLTPEPQLNPDPSQPDSTPHITPHTNVPSGAVPGLAPPSGSNATDHGLFLPPHNNQPGISGPLSTPTLKPIAPGDMPPLPR